MPTKESLLATIEEFRQELTEQESAVRETKQIINRLSRRAGLAEPFAEAEAREGAVMSSGNPTEIKLDEFARAGSPSEAVIAYLTKRGEATKLEEVYAALKRGGYAKSKSLADLRVAVGKSEDIRRFPETDAVGLEAWYGGGRRRPKTIGEMIRASAEKPRSDGDKKEKGEEVEEPNEE